MDHYENDFEAAMLKDTSAYYSRKASNWMLEDSYPDYMLKVWFLRCPYHNLVSSFTLLSGLCLISCVFYHRLRSA